VASVGPAQDVQAPSFESESGVSDAASSDTPGDTLES
jgi:hypothetical protein